MVRLELGVESDWAVILSGGVVEVVIERGEVDLFLYSILIRHAQEILGVHGEEEIDRPLGQLLVIEKETAHIEPAELLQDEHYCIVLELEDVEDVVYFVEAVQLQDL
jgi:hypothetical protein